MPLLIGSSETWSRYAPEADPTRTDALAANPTIADGPCVYFLQSGRYGPVKIGWSATAKARVRALQTAHHGDLRLLAAIPGSRDDERHWHTLNAVHWIRGEWFRAASELVRAIEDAAAMARIKMRGVL